MSKKQDAYYFDNFYTCADYACQAAHLLDKVRKSWMRCTRLSIRQMKKSMICLMC